MKVTFSTGTSSLELDCDVKFGAEPIGETDTRLNNSLQELYSGGRIVFHFSNFCMNTVHRTWFTKFLFSTNKTITIYGEETEVVNSGDGEKQFKLVDKSDHYFTINATFKTRWPSVMNYSAFLGLKRVGVVP